jgi:hypothetical protein
MARKETVEEMVVARIHASRFGYASWITKMPADLRAEFEQARQQWDSSKHSQASYARAVIEVARLLGVDPLPSFDAVCRWLRQRNNKA